VICSYKGKRKTTVFEQWKPKQWRIGIWPIAPSNILKW
jgi:hypothetical protein